MQLRSCISGEAYTTDGRCEECPANSYLLEALKSPMECAACPENGVCLGGNRIGPLPGYWRMNAESVNMMACFNPSTCLGTIETAYVPQGTCLEGHEGFLCAECSLGYTGGTEYECHQCPPIVTNLIVSSILVGLFLATMVVATR